MSAEGFFPFFVAYAILAAVCISLSLLTVAGFAGLAALDFLTLPKFPKWIRVTAVAFTAILPQLGVPCWALSAGRARPWYLRLAAMLGCGTILLLQAGWLDLGARDRGLAAGLLSVGIMHLLWWPFMVFGGGISFLALRYVRANKPRQSVPRIG